MTKKRQLDHLDGERSPKKSKTEVEPSSSSEETESCDSDIDMNPRENQSDMVQTTFVIRGLIDDDQDDSPYYNGIKAMVNSLTVQMDKKVLSSDLATAIVEQGNIGGVIGQEEDEDDDDNDIFGYYTVLSLLQHLPKLRGLINFITRQTGKSGSSEFKATWESIKPKDFAPDNAEALPINPGLWLCQKAQNMPIPVILDMYHSAMADIKWSQEVTDPDVGMTEVERKFYTYSHIVAIFPVHLMKPVKKGCVESDLNNMVFNTVDNEVIWQSCKSKMLIPRGTMTEILISGQEDHQKGHDYLALMILTYEEFVSAAAMLETHASLMTQ